MKKTIRDAVKTPFNALLAMCDGLERQAKRDDFRVNMAYYLIAADDICYGCAATCAVMEITGKDVTLKDILAVQDAREVRDLGELMFKNRGVFLPDWGLVDIRDFESNINLARTGDIVGLWNYFGEFCPGPLSDSVTWKINTDNWRKEIKKVRHWVRMHDPHNSYKTLRGCSV